MPSPAVIVLEDGALFHGEALAGSGSVGGEVVFNTSMAGYQEIATDPSYCGQLVTYTFPMNGNYGADPDRDESGKAHARAIITRELTNYRYNRASRTTWLDWLAEHGVLAVTGVDTRALTRHIREAGAMRAVVSTETADVKHLRQAAQKLPVMSGLDLAKVVTCAEAYEAPAPEGAPAPDLHVVAFDYGIKRSMLGYLANAGFRVTVVPASTSAKDVLKREPDGVFLSNGPGDPAAVGYAVKTIERLLGKVPLFGICLGHQLLAQALGLSTYKLKFGHRGANHPVKDLRTGSHRDHHAEPRLRREERAGAGRRDHAHQPQRRHRRGRGGAQRLRLLRPVPPGVDTRSSRLAVPVRPLPRGDRALQEGRCLMPRRDDLHKILIIGSGPIVIGQACEFDYSGAQACKVLLEEGYEVVLVNSNPATIMTDPEFATRTYIEPLDLATLTRIIEVERPDALLPTLGGQTALNLAMELKRPACSTSGRSR